MHRLSPVRVYSIFELLEKRLVLSASLDGAGQLVIEGSDSADVMSLRPARAPGGVVVRGVPDVPGGTVFSNVTSIVLHAGPGNDTVFVVQGLVDSTGAAMPIMLDGGLGDDRICCV